MKNFNIFFGRLLVGMVVIFCFFSIYNKATAQKMLSEHETAIVEEAYAELNSAISNPDLLQAERLRLVERSAKTLKEYGQPLAFPKGDIPLKTLMKHNFTQASKQYNDVNRLRQSLISKQLEARMKFINAVQIEVVEEQIKLLIPGEEEFELSKDLVGTVFSWNIVEGFNEGKVNDAKELVSLFKKAAEINKFTLQLDQLFKDHKFNMDELFRDLKQVDPLEALLRKRYENAAASTFTIKGYEGALVAQKLVAKTAAPTEKTVTPKMDATDDGFKETKYYYRLLKCETVKKVNNPGHIKSIEVSDNSMSASVIPPKPKEPFTTTANWNSPPSVIYPGDVVTLTAKGNGDARIRIEGSCDYSRADGVRVTEGPGSSTVNFKWKFVGSGPYMHISVRTLVTANTWGWTSANYLYEYVLVE